MQIGDEIRILPGAESSYYSDGCKARLTQLDSDGDWWADFNNSENSPGSYDEDEGVWCVGKADRFELVTPETSTQTVAQLQARVAELEAALADEREKSAFWAEKAHEMRGQALRGEPVDGIIQP